MGGGSGALRNFGEGDARFLRGSEAARSGRLGTSAGKEGARAPNGFYGFDRAYEATCGCFNGHGAAVPRRKRHPACRKLVLVKPTASGRGPKKI